MTTTTTDEPRLDKYKFDGVPYRFIIDGITPNATQFKSKKAGEEGKQFHCHYLQLRDEDGIVITGQVTNIDETYTAFAKGAQVTVSFKTHKKGKYHLEEKKISAGWGETPNPLDDESQYEPEQEFNKSGGPKISEIDRQYKTKLAIAALNASIEMHRGDRIPTSAITNDALDFLMWLEVNTE